MRQGPDVFVSYSSDDRSAAERVAIGLSRIATEVFWDRSIGAGLDFTDVIQEKLERARCVVVEDSISGVQAGRAGGFGLVVGVDRKGDPESLRANGADIVVQDLQELLR